MTMIKNAISLACCVTLSAALSATLSACDSKTSANEKNFGSAVAQYFDKKGALCLDPVTWPVDVYQTDVRQQKLYPDGVAGRMAALEAAGLARGEDVDLPEKVKVRRYTMADVAKPYLRTDPGRQPRLCWGRKSLDKVVRWTEPAKAGDHEEASVIYKYRLSDVAAWAGKPQVKEAFPTLGRTVDGERAQQEKLVVRLTPQGWQGIGLND
jgi:hypothetical protein